MHNRK